MNSPDKKPIRAPHETFSLTEKLTQVLQKRRQSLLGESKQSFGSETKLLLSPRRWDYFFLGFILLFVTVVRIRLLGFPLERDEGEYAYMGQLMLQGIPPYQLAYNMKLPGIYALYAIFEALFGQTASGIHAGLLCANLTAIILLFLLCKKLFSSTAAIVAGATYAALSLSYSVLGFAAHATQFIVPCVLGGFLLLLHALEQPRVILFFLSGILLGLSVLVKQSAAPFCIWGVVAIALSPWSAQTTNKRKLLFASLLTAGVLTPIAMTFFTLYSVGVFEKFWFWNFTYLKTYASQISIGAGLVIFKDNFLEVIGDYSILWITSFLGLGVICLSSKMREKKWLLLSFTFFSFLSICPGLYFRSHYFVTLLPATALAVGAFFDFIHKKWIPRKNLVLILFFAVLLAGLSAQKDYLFLESPMKLSRIIYGGNPFPESPKIAKILQAMTRPNETIAILGSEPQIFYYSNRRSATGYIYMYALMENQVYSLDMQKEMVREIESANPRFIVFVTSQTSWLLSSAADSYLFDWWNHLIREERYQVIGVADIFSDQTIYRLGAEVNDYKPTSNSQVLIYKRADPKNK